MDDPALLECLDLHVSVGHTEVTRGLNLSIQRGECWCILGRNGSGKTTLIHTLAGLRVADQGIIRLAGQPLQDYSRRELATRIGIQFQDQDDPFPATVLETVLQGRHPYLRPWQWETAMDQLIAIEALEFVDIEALQQRNIQTLSGGERQRVAIATLITQQPELLFLDEPTSHLDLHHRVDILQRLVASCLDANHAICLVLHDINLAARLASHVLLLLENGQSYAGPSQDLLKTARLEQLYGHPLIQWDTPAGPAWLPA